MPLCWNWQTRWTQNPFPATGCGFKSRQRHQKTIGDVACRFFIYIYNEKIFNTNSQVTFFDSYNIAKRWDVNLIEEKNLLPSVVKLANDWGVKYEKIIDIVSIIVVCVGCPCTDKHSGAGA